MTRRSVGIVAMLGAFFVAVAVYALWTQPAIAVTGEAFPVGLVAGALVLAPRKVWPLVLVATLVVSTGLYHLFDRPLLQAFGSALGAALSAWVPAVVMSRAGKRPPELMTDRDLSGYVLGSLGGALLGGLVAAGTSLLSGAGEPWVVLLATSLAQMASFLVLLPHFVVRPSFPGVAGRTERIVQWASTVLVTAMIFSPLQIGLSLAFVVLPFLGWSALRGPMRETLVQLLVVMTLAQSLTVQGFGPFAAGADATPSHATLVASVLHVFGIACALVAVPFAMAVGAQRRDYAQARQEKNRLQSLVQSATGVLIIGTDGHGRIDIFNPGAQAVLGYAPDEVMGRISDMFHTDAELARIAALLDVEADFRTVARAMAGRDNAAIDVEFVRRDGDVRTIQLTISRMTDAAGNITGYVSTGEDVTKRVQQQRALEDALAAERLAVEHLREVDQVKDAFVSGVSHELRTPITSILGYLEMLEEGGFGPMHPTQVKALGRVKGNSRRLLSLIDDLLTLSRIHDGSLAVATVQLDLTEVVRNAYEEMSPGLQAAGIDFTVSLPDDHVFVVGDEERLGRVMVNLLGNAAKFTDRYGKVDLSLSVDGQTAVVAVRDTGIGIPAAEQAKLFDRFFRSASARERAIQGSGLGLSIARAIVETHGGIIDVESGEGIGSTFRVRLPLEGAEPLVPGEEFTVLDEYDDRDGVLAS